MTNMTMQEKVNLMAIISATTNTVKCCTKTIINLKRLSEFVEDKRSMIVIEELKKIAEEIVEDSNFITAVCKTMAIDGKSDADSIMKTLAEIKRSTEV